MAASHDAGATPDDRDDAVAAPDVALDTVVVRYETGPDRRTVYPADADDFERLTRWFTANDDAFVRLDESR